MKEKATQPPKSYTEGTLLKAMESAGKSIEDEALRDAMKDSGLGTPATRAATIERLKRSDILRCRAKNHRNPKGRTAVELIRHAGVELLASPEMTGQWERRLHQISKGEASADVFMQNVQKFTVSIINKVSSQRPAPSSLSAGMRTSPKEEGREARLKRPQSRMRRVSARASALRSQRLPLQMKRRPYDLPWGAAQDRDVTGIL